MAGNARAVGGLRGFPGEPFLLARIEILSRQFRIPVAARQQSGSCGQHEEEGSKHLLSNHLSKHLLSNHLSRLTFFGGVECAADERLPEADGFGGGGDFIIPEAGVKVLTSGGVEAAKDGVEIGDGRGIGNTGSAHVTARAHGIGELLE